MENKLKHIYVVICLYDACIFLIQYENNLQYEANINYVLITIHSFN